MNDENNSLGRSQNSGDAYFSGLYDEFRIWEGALTPGEAAASYAAGPKVLPLPKLQISASGGNLILSWLAWAGRYTPHQATGLGGSWMPVIGTPVSNGVVLKLTVPHGGSVGFYRLAQ